MPELPEVETTRRGLASIMLARRIAHVRLFRADLRFPFPEGFCQHLTGRVVTQVGRRGKLLLITLDNGATWLAHLGMTGRFRFHQGEENPRIYPVEFVNSTQKSAKNHTHMTLMLDDQIQIHYQDPRRFGYMGWAWPNQLEQHPYFRLLGPDPFDRAFTSAYLAGKGQQRRSTLKTLLLDQSVLAGIGNIYASEALHVARLRPDRASNGATAAEYVRLHRAIMRILRIAIRSGGVTLRDFAAPDDSLGRYGTSVLVYDRKGEPCLRRACRGVISRELAHGRASYYCPVCQL